MRSTPNEGPATGGDHAWRQRAFGNPQRWVTIVSHPAPPFGHHSALLRYSIAYPQASERGSIEDGSACRKVPIVHRGVGDSDESLDGDAETVRVVGARVRKLREAAGLTQEDLGARSNLTPKFISKVENGHANPSIGVVARLCVGLNLPLSIFFAEERDGDLARDLSHVMSLIGSESSERRAQAIRVLRALFNK